MANTPYDDVFRTLLNDCSFLIKVAEHIAAKYSKVKERVKKIMTGQILEYEAKIIKNQGRAEGIKSVITHMYSKGFTLSQIAMATDKDESEIRLIIENE